MSFDVAIILYCIACMLLYVVYIFNMQDKYKMVTGTFQDVIVMTALSDCIALKAPEKSGEWEFINTTLAGSTFKV